MTKFLSFSERCGHIEVSDVLQIDSMSGDLKNCLWNAIDPYIHEQIFHDDGKFIESFCQHIIKQSVSSIPHNKYDKKSFIEEAFLGLSWHQVYSTLEFLFFKDEHFCFSPPSLQILNSINSVLENENSAYRLIDGKIVPITDKTEIDEIQEVLTGKFVAAQKHLKAALAYLADKTSKDFRNSVKESISAVESVARELAGESTLGRSLKELKMRIPDTLRQGFEKIYGWTNGEDGIRHALMDGAEPVGMAEAKFMLVACSAFINYLKMK